MPNDSQLTVPQGPAGEWGRPQWGEGRRREEDEQHQAESVGRAHPIRVTAPRERGLISGPVLR